MRGWTEPGASARRPRLLLTANATTIHVMTCVNLTDLPMVVRVPPRALGPVDGSRRQRY